MADKFIPFGQDNVPIKAVDNGDGTYSFSTSSEGGGAGGPDREFIVSYFRATNAFTGASVGDLIRSVAVYDLSGADPVQVGTTDWSNETTQLPLASAPSPADLEPAMGATGVTNAELVAALATQTGTKTTASAALPAGGSGFIGWLSNLYHSFFGVADATADSGNPVKIGGRYANTSPILTAGNRGDVLVSRSSSVMVAIDTSSGPTDAFANTSAAFLLGRSGSTVLPTSGNYNFNGTTWDRARGNTAGTFMQGNVANATADAGNPVKIGAIYNSAPVPVGNGQRTNLQANVNGSMLVVPENGAALTDSAATAYSSNARNGADVIFGSANMVYDGVNYIRQRGGLQGTMMQGSVASGAADAGNPVKVGGIYRSAPASVLTGQRADFTVTQWGSQFTSFLPSGVAAADAIANTSVIMPMSAYGSGATIPASASWLYNGTSWDRARGDATGAAVNTLKRPLVARQIAVTSASNPVELTPAVKRVSIYARGGDMRFRFANATTTAVATDHFIAQGERLDLNCEVGATPWIAVIRDGATDGTLELSELS